MGGDREISGIGMHGVKSTGINKRKKYVLIKKR